MKLSIVTPCYNSASTIRNTLRSVEDQKIKDLEHVIIDGGSTDDTMSILQAYADGAEYDVRITSEPDDGIYDAMNKGIRMAEGDLIGIINSDDWYEPGAFERILSAYRNNDLEVIYGMIRLYDRDRLRSMEFYHHDFLLDRMINHPGCFVTRGAYQKVGSFDTSFRSSADYDWMKRAMDAGCTFTPVYDVLANVRAGGMSSTGVGYRETLKLQHQWGRVSGIRYAAYSLKSRIGDALHDILR